MKNLLIAIFLILFISSANQVNASAKFNLINNSVDSTPKSKSGQITIDLSDFDRSLKEIDNVVSQLNKKVQDVDWDKLSADINNSLNKINVEKIKEDIKTSMKKIEWERINGDVKKSLSDANEQIQKAITEIDAQMNSEKIKSHKEELKKDMEELKKDLQKNKDQLQKEIQRSKSVTKTI